MVAVEGSVPRNDQIMPATRWVSFAVVLILIPAFVILWWLPSHTADAWAWTIKPRMTPIFMGSGYAAGAFFFARAFRGRSWHHVSAGVLSAAIFALLMLGATLLGWDRFNHGNAPFVAAFMFYGWVAVYIVSPALVGLLWLRNERTDPRVPDARDAQLPPAVLLAARGVGVGAITAGAIFYVAPSVAMQIWPWHLTPLTTRVLASFTIQVAAGALLLSRDARWSTWRVLLQTFLVASVLMLVGAARAWSDFDHGNPLSWLFVAGLAGMAAAIVVVYRRTEGLASVGPTEAAQPEAA
jgi:peptidoglycan/LPS O-acetylase OafA/YrhL